MSRCRPYASLLVLPLHLRQLGSRFQKTLRATMNIKAFFGLVLTVTLLVAIVLRYSHVPPANRVIAYSDGVFEGDSPGTAAPTDLAQAGPALSHPTPLPRNDSRTGVQAELLIQATNKLERLSQIREQFQALARGEPAAA